MPVPSQDRFGAAEAPADDALRITKRTMLQEIADRMMAAGACSAPLYSAAAAGQIALIQINEPNAVWPSETIARPNRPIVVLVSGDPGWGQPTFGPDQWRCANKLRAWSAGAIVHGAAGEADHYRQAVVLAVLLGRLAFIETTSGLARAWDAFLAPVPRIDYLPTEGTHPVAPAVRH